VSIWGELTAFLFHVQQTVDLVVMQFAKIELVFLCGSLRVLRALCGYGVCFVAKEAKNRKDQYRLLMS
jgi:hypothetical protein